jgi:hypothetical protein
VQRRANVLRAGASPPLDRIADGVPAISPALPPKPRSQPSPNGTQDVFEAGKGDGIFAPQGHYHYFENASATEELVALIVFNSDAAEPKDDIGIGQSLTAIPNVVLSAVLNVPVSVFEQIPTVGRRIVIVKRPEGQTGGQTVRVLIEPFHYIKLIGSSRF